MGVAAEYGGRVATATAKEVAAVALRTASEAEAALAAAERAKSACPLCAGLAAAAAAVALALPRAAPPLLLGAAPVAGALCAAVGALALARAAARAAAAENLGRRRFASSAEVGATWRSQTEMVFARDLSERRRHATVALALLPAPLAALVPGSGQFRAVAAASASAAQAAYHVAAAEWGVAHAADAVADKQRTAAIIDTYANQAARVGALLPFTSALGSLIYVSHEWGGRDEPDPTGEQFEVLAASLEACDGGAPSRLRECVLDPRGCYLWLDYWSAPQSDPVAKLRAARNVAVFVSAADAVVAAGANVTRASASPHVDSTAAASSSLALHRHDATSPYPTSTPSQCFATSFAHFSMTSSSAFQNEATRSF